MRRFARAALAAASLLAASPALAQEGAPPPATASTGGAATAGPGGNDDGMRPGVAAPPAEKYPYFFAAYGIVWAAVLAYVIYLGSRVRGLEERLGGPGRS